MLYRTYLILMLVFIFETGFTQIHLFNEKTSQPILSKTDSALSAALPILSIPESQKKLELPWHHDNSEMPYLRPVFQQIGASCGQACGVSYNFTYEINRKRGLFSNDSANQYPSHFTWIFMNGGDGWYGVSYLHSFEILKTLGVPNVVDYGGMNPGDNITWVSGYNMYYNGMYNRIRGVNKILTEDEQGLLTLKHWLHNHLEGSDEGGIASFYAPNPYLFSVLPPNTPEEGKYVVPSLPGLVATHALTIVGYNDSIRFDYNGDGQYTNNIDINEDGTINMKDWEIGGVKILNSYGDDWCDSGFCYMMYKVMADDLGDGGIWNQSAHLLDVKEEYQPLLTFKFTIKHDSREKIKITAGVSSDTSSQLPEHVISFPVFDFQGGHHYMQGGRDEEYRKFIEAGLDVTPLLSFVEPGQPAKFFIQVIENDPNNEGTGRIIDFTLMDYTGNLIAIECEDNDVQLIDDGITRLSILHTPDFDKVEIVNDELPATEAGTIYNAQIETQNGSEPFRWDIITPYFQQQPDFPMPEINDERLYPLQPFGLFATKKLSFEFPFYGEMYDSVFIHKNGFIMFDNDLYPWPYFNDTYLLFRKVKNISVFMLKTVEYYADQINDEAEIWYEGDETYAAFRWNGPLFYLEEEIGFGEFALVLYPDGNINFFYNDIEIPEDILWYAGVSAGNEIDYNLLNIANSNTLPEVSSFILQPDTPPVGLFLDQDGLLFGFPEVTEKIENISINVCDDNSISTNKTFQISDGLIFQYQINTGADSIIQNGETISINLTVKNIFTEPFHNINALLIVDDPLLEPENTVADIGDLDSGESVTIQDAFVVKISQACPDQYTFINQLKLLSDEADWSGNLTFEARTINIEVYTFEIQDDNNNHLDPGETANLNVELFNSSVFEAANVQVTLSTIDDFITIQEPVQQYGNLQSGDSKALLFPISADPATPIGHVVDFNIGINFDPQQQLNYTRQIIIGQHTALIINMATTNTSSEAILESLESLGIEPVSSSTIPENLELYRSVFLCLGSFYTSAALDMDEGMRLANYLNVRGNLYMEGTMTWRFNDQTAVHALFGFETENADYVEFSTYNGISGTFTEEMLFGFSEEYNNLPYTFIPTEPTFAIFNADNDNEKQIVIANATENYQIIGAIHEFGTMGDETNAPERKDYMYQILNFFGLEDYFANTPEIPEISPEDISVQAIPNPFNDHVNLFVELEKEAVVHIEIFDLSGQLIKRLYSQQNLIPGSYNFKWNGQSNQRRQVPPGIYIFQLRADNATKTGKIIRLK